MMASGSPAKLDIWCPSELHRRIRIPHKHWASGAPVNFTGEYSIPYKHWASGASVNFIGEYGIPCKHWASGAPVNVTGEYGMPYKHWASGALVNFTREYGICCKHRASGAPVNFTREYGIPCKHRASGAPVNVTGEYSMPCKHWASGAPVIFTREYGIPCKHWASGAPVNITGEHSIPCNTKYLTVQLNSTNGIHSLMRSSHCTQHIYHHALVIFGYELLQNLLIYALSSTLAGHANAMPYINVIFSQLHGASRKSQSSCHGCFTCIPRVQLSNFCAMAKWRPLPYASHV